MKAVKLFLILVVMILSLPFVFADMQLYNFQESTYNFGDKVSFSGSVNYAEDVRANLNIALSCDGKSENVGVELFNLHSGEVVEFSKFVTLPNTLTGKCNVVVNLVDLNGKTLETKTFSGFELSNSLDGNFETPKENYQLGESFVINGFVTKKSGNVIDGIAKIYYKQGSKSVFLDTVEVSKGVVKYSKELSRFPDGEYKIDIYADDNFGNKKVFSDLFTIKISGSLVINLNFDRNIYNPGDKVAISGSVSNGLGQKASDVSIRFNFEDKEVVLNNINGFFNLNYDIPKNVKSGVHGLDVVADNDEGNFGFLNFNYSVNALASLLKLNLKGSSYDPEQNIEFSVGLFDQAGDNMNENVNVYLLNAKDEVLGSKIVATGTNDSILVPAGANPGNWKLKVEGFGLSSEAMINIREYTKLDSELSNGKLVVKNLGNIPYKGLFEIGANDLKKVKDLKLKVGDSKTFELGKLFPSGTYKLKVPTTNDIFDNVKVESKSLFGGLGGLTGRVTQNTEGTGRKTVLFVGVVTLVGCLMYLLFARRKKDEFSSSLSSKQKKVLSKTKVDEKKPSFEYGRATQADIDDWKNRIKKDFEDQEKGKNTREFLDGQRKSINENKPRDGLFNMFR